MRICMKSFALLGVAFVQQSYANLDEQIEKIQHFKGQKELHIGRQVNQGPLISVDEKEAQEQQNRMIAFWDDSKDNTPLTANQAFINENFNNVEIWEKLKNSGVRFDKIIVDLSVMKFFNQNYANFFHKVSYEGTECVFPSYIREVGIGLDFEKEGAEIRFDTGYSGFPSMHFDYFNDKENEQEILYNGICVEFEDRFVLFASQYFKQVDYKHDVFPYTSNYNPHEKIKYFHLKGAK